MLVDRKKQTAYFLYARELTVPTQTMHFFFPYLFRLFSVVAANKEVVCYMEW